MKGIVFYASVALIFLMLTGDWMIMTTSAFPEMKDLNKRGFESGPLNGIRQEPVHQEPIVKVNVMPLSKRSDAVDEDPIVQVHFPVTYDKPLNKRGVESGPLNGIRQEPVHAEPTVPYNFLQLNKRGDAGIQQAPVHHELVKQELTPVTS